MNTWTARFLRATLTIMPGIGYCRNAFATGQFEKAVQIDPVFGLPVPPVRYDGSIVGQFDPTSTAVATRIFIAIFVGAIIWGMQRSIKTKSAIPICLALTGIPCVFAELNLDVMGAVIYPSNPDSVLFTLMGRHMGWFIIAAWSAYGGLFALASYLIFSRPQLPTRFIWLGFAMVCVGQTFFEELLSHFNGIYYYYGNQPLTPISQFPWWIIFPTSGGVCFLSALTYRFNASLKGWRALGLVVCAPFTFCGFMGFVSLPAWIAVNSELPHWVNNVLGLSTVIAGLIAFAMTMKLILQRDPLQPDGIGKRF